LEDRQTPSITPTQVFDALHQNVAGQQVLGFIAEYPQVLVQRAFQPFARDLLIVTAERSEAAAAVLDQFLRDLQAQVAANPSQTVALQAIPPVLHARFQALTIATVAKLDLQYVNQALGIGGPPPAGSSPVPPPVSPPTPDLSSDSGMTNTVPDITANGFTELPNGVRIRDVQVGTGPEVTPGAAVQVYYTGYLTNGTVFDSRRSPQQPATFSLNGVIPGFAAGLLGMQRGGVRDIVIPPELAYGSTGTSTIPPDSTLIFQVKLISIA
jgi:hypothetical protein